MIALALALVQTPDVAEMERRILTCALLNDIETNRSTLERLLPLALRAREAAGEYERDLQELQQEQLRAFEAFRAEAVQNEGFTVECERAAAEAEDGQTVLQRRYADQVNSLERDALEVLTARQAALLRDAPTFDELIRRYTADDANSASVAAAIRNLVDRARRLSEATYARRRESFVRQAIASLPDPAEPIQDPEAYRAAIGRALDDLRLVEEPDLDAAIPGAIQDMRARPPEELLREELAAIHRGRHGELGEVAELLVQPAVIWAIEVRLGTGHPSPPSAPSNNSNTHSCCGSDPRTRIGRLRREISLLNLANGLGFTFHQMAHIYGEAARNGQIQEWEESQWAPAAGRDVETYQGTLARVLEAIEEGSSMPSNDLRRIPGEREAAFRRRQVPPSPHVPRPQRGEADQLVENVREMLFAGQLDVLMDYNACLVPPANLKDPVRVGQANDRSAVVSALEHVRGIPAATWRANQERILDEMMRQAEAAHGRFPAGERESRGRRLAEVLDQVRSMGDVDFELQKDVLAEELDFLNREEEIQRRIVELAGEEGAARQKIRQFLLDPVMADLLRERLFLLRDRRHAELVDLDAISPADACRDGLCAVSD